MVLGIWGNVTNERLLFLEKLHLNLSKPRCAGLHVTGLVRMLVNSLW
ncbi:hypothetical protein OMCYN_01206 [cyanobiont of Ornithocercus magnificus]|nr:hypothetical protein OMCYN_01206 [cyanobiont of Ornithocercus magnificus]